MAPSSRFASQASASSGAASDGVGISVVAQALAGRSAGVARGVAAGSGTRWGAAGGDGEGDGALGSRWGAGNAGRRNQSRGGGLSSLYKACCGICTNSARAADRAQKGCPQRGLQGRERGPLEGFVQFAPQPRFAQRARRFGQRAVHRSECLWTCLYGTHALYKLSLQRGGPELPRVNRDGLRQVPARL